MPFHLLPKVLPAGASLTRRGFLSGLALGSGALALGRTARADDDELWYAWVSDTHIAADPKARSRDQCMAENLRAVVADILARPGSPRGVLIDGDLALNDGQPGDYATLLDLIEPLRQAKRPIHLALGNHDDRAHFRAALHAEPPPDAAVEDKHVSVVNGPCLRHVVLDSLQRPNFTPGLLGERQLGWLGKALDAEKDVPTILFVHHNLSKDAGALNDTEALLELVTPRRQVKAIVYGHSHRWSHEDRDGLHLVNLPAVAYPFSPDQPLGWVRFRAMGAGAELELRCVGGDRSKDQQRLSLKWRAT